jgi:hypothetical protein
MGCAPEDALDLGRGQLGEFHAPLHCAARFPLQLVTALLEGHRGSISGVGGQGTGWAEGARVAKARRCGREGGQEACRLEGEEERATQCHGCGGGGMRHGVAVTAVVETLHPTDRV